MKKSKLFHNFDPFKVAFIYFVVGILWILFSDLFLEISFDKDIVIELQTYKGWFFIFITALLVFLLTKKLTKQIETKSNNEYRLNNVINELNHLVAILNPNFEIIDTNRISYELINTDKKELLGKKFWDTPWFNFDKTYQKRIKELLIKVKDGESILTEGYLVKNGEILYSSIYIKPIFKNNELINIMVEGENITELKLTQMNLENLNKNLEKNIKIRTEELKKVNDLVKDVETFANVGYWKINLTKKEKFWSEGIYNILELKDKKIQNTNELLELIPIENRHIALEAINELKTNPKANIHITYPVVLENNNKKYFETIAKRADENEEIIIVGTDRDITKKYLLEEKQKEQEKTIEKQKKQAEMGQLITDISHHWRQPLNIIGIIIQNIYDAYIHNELSKESLKEDVDKSINQLLSLSKTIDIFSRLNKEKEKESFLISEAIERAIKKTNFSSDTLIDKELQAITIYGALEDFIVSMENILQNAKEVFKNKEGKKLFIKVFKDNQNISISISDNGRGIPEDILNKIFEPYSTSKFQGGIGLFISKIFIEKSFQGKITAENIKEGAKFTITIPLI